MGPVLANGFPGQTHDSHWHVRWLTCFATQFWMGELYPHWLSSPNYGFGSATFYFYPPLPYWCASLFCSLPVSPAGAWRALGMAAVCAQLASGIAALRLFDRFTTPWRSMICASAYMTFPYRLTIDLYDRGAFAEFCAFFWMPMIVSALYSMRERRPNAVFKASLTIAALALTHLPTLMTFGIAVAVYCILSGVALLLRVSAAAAIALALAAVYIVPALGMQSAVRFDALDREILVSMFFPTLHFSQPLAMPTVFNQKLAVIAALFGGVCVVAVVPLLRQNGGFAAERVRWIIVSVAVTALMLPLSIDAYRVVPGLATIQFAWRFLAPATVVIFLLLSLMLGRDPRSSWWGKGTLGLVLAFNCVFLGFSWAGGKGNRPVVTAGQMDVREYRPRSANFQSALAVMRDDLVVGATLEAVREWRGRTIDIVLIAENNQHVLLRQWFFPDWTAEAPGQALPIAKDASSGLIDVQIPAGRTRVKLKLRPTKMEKTGFWISAVTWSGLLVAWMFCRLSRRQKNVTETNRQVPPHATRPGQKSVSPKQFL